MRARSQTVVEKVDYISQNPQFITNGFLWERISQTLDQVEDEADNINSDQPLMKMKLRQL